MRLMKGITWHSNQESSSGGRTPGPRQDKDLAWKVSEWEFWAAGIACAKALRWEGAQCGWSTEDETVLQGSGRQVV